MQANPDLWKDTAIFVTFDEGGGYYDSGYVQPLDFFGGTAPASRCLSSLPIPPAVAWSMNTTITFRS